MFAKLIEQNLTSLPLGKKLGPIGVDFGTEKINLVQLARQKQDYQIMSAASLAYPETREHMLNNPLLLRQMIKEALQKYHFSGNHAVASLPPNMIKLSLLNYQCHDNQKVADAITDSLKENYEDILAESVIDYIPIRPKVTEQIDRTALVAIADKTEVTEYLEMLRMAGLKVKNLEIGPVAIKRLMTNIEDNRHSVNKILSINFGTRNSFVTVLWGGELLLDRELNIGLNSTIERIAEDLEIAEHEALTLMHKHGLPENTDNHGQGNNYFNEDISDSLARILKPIFLRFSREIKKVLIYTAAETQGGAIDKVYLLGSLARWPNIDRYVANLINIPVKTINPFFGFSEKNVNINLDELEPVSGIAVATGLALNDQ